jgi:hypothetical protein
MEVQFGNFVRGNWLVNNLNDETRVYSISAEVQISSERAISTLVNGVVKKDDDIVGRFSLQGGVSIPSFTPQTADSTEAINAYQAVITFVNEVAQETIDNPPFNIEK